MPSRTKKRCDHSESREESLGVPERLEATHPPFPFPGGLMGILRPIIQPPLLLVLHRRHHFYLGRHIAAQFVGDDRSWDVLQSFQQLAQELLGGPFVPPLQSRVPFGKLLLASHAVTKQSEQCDSQLCTGQLDLLL